MQRTFVIGDIHGAYEALFQCFERADFDTKKDRLICLGDVCDRRPNVRECIDELLKIEQLVFIMGNHDKWALEWMENNNDPSVWLMQGGNLTVKSYRTGVPEAHRELLRSALYYYEENNCLYVHGGIDHRLPLNIQHEENFIWDRSLVNTALEYTNQNRQLTDYDEIFVGHTPTIRLPEDVFRGNPKNYPLKLCNVWLMDTGAGWTGGKLSIMDVDSKEVFQSDVLG